MLFVLVVVAMLALPAGDALLSGGVGARVEALGVLALLDDGLVARVVLAVVPDAGEGGLAGEIADADDGGGAAGRAAVAEAARALAALAATSHALRAFADANENWRALAAAARTYPPFAANDTWKSAFLRAAMGVHSAPAALAPKFHSDFLFRPWLCATAHLQPHWTTRETVREVDANALTPGMFASLERQHIPVVVRNAAADWPALRRWRDSRYIARALPRAVINETPVDTQTFFTYLNHCPADEAPLYLFDPLALKRAPLSNDYTPPAFLPDDLFALLGDEDGGQRPHHRWLIVGARNSGSFFHVDPNGTSAWNAVVVGEKRWVFYPPEGDPPPGVQPSDDGTDVYTPVSLMEWYLNFYDGAHADRLASKRAPTRPLECTARAGDLVFVPSGWWHQVVNTATDRPTIAVTANFCSRANLAHVLSALDKGGRHVSGISGDALATLGTRFRGVLEASAPDALAEAEREMSGSGAAKRKRGGDDGAWAHPDGAPFCFNFSL